MHPILAERLHNQRLARPARSAVEVVAAMAAMQAQDFAAGMWAIGVRTRAGRLAEIARLIDDGAIIRTHPMRGTHHFIARDDLRWMLAVLAPAALAKVAPRHRTLALDAATLRKALAALARALEGGRDLVRAEVADVLRRARIAPDGQRLPHIIMHAEHTGLVCSGPRRGKQITIALVDDRVPRGRPIARDAALRELARRYFATRGPATRRDFVWWSGLRAADAAAAIEHAQLATETIDGVTYYRGAATRPRPAPGAAYLLPAYDEYAVSYQRRELLGVAPAARSRFGEQTLLAPIVIVGGRVAGTWRRIERAARVVVEIDAWRTLVARERAAIEAAAEDYARYAERELVLRWRG